MTSPSDLVYFISQKNLRVGNIEFNKEAIIKDIEAGQQSGADIIIFPELALSGYPPRDLLLFDSFHEEIESAISQIKEVITTSHVILGVPLYDNENRLRNTAIVMSAEGIIYRYYKTLLPDYDVFDESRYFYPDETNSIVEIKGVNIGLQICEDAWDHLWMHGVKVTAMQVELGADIIINISASPFTTTKAKNRLDLVVTHVKSHQVPFIYANLLGCQDDLVFDGRSFAVNSRGELCFGMPAFQEVTGRITSSNWDNPFPEENYYLPTEEETFEAITLNLSDYLIKSALPDQLLVAVSGGIDSALTLALMAGSVPPENITAVYLPTEFSSSQSYEDAKALCDNYNVELLTLEIEGIRKLYDEALKSLTVVGDTWSVADENIQARIRANVMMYLSNKLGKLLISTGNKSEIATGYCTLYGDTAGGKNLIGDLYKSQVYSLVNWINQNGKQIPQTILDRPPTAELKDGQLDTDSLPDYDVLDQILAEFIDNYQSTAQIIAKGFDETTVRRVIKMVVANEFKRDQIAQTVKVSDKAFGSGRKFPIASTYLP